MLNRFLYVSVPSLIFFESTCMKPRSSLKVSTPSLGLHAILSADLRQPFDSSIGACFFIGITGTSF